MTMLTLESVSTIVLVLLCAFVASFFLCQDLTLPIISAWLKHSDDDVSFNSSQYRAISLELYTSMRGLRILELKAETYNGLVRLLKPGFRSIILLVDEETKEKLVHIFKRAVWPYRNNKVLQFGYLCLDKNLDWYESLLGEVLGIEYLRVNKKNCVGTVLSLNGFKRYFRIYHSMHREVECNEDNDNDSSDENSNVEYSIEEAKVSQIGFERKKNRSGETGVDNLLNHLPEWLDRMFDGRTKRYFLSAWPEEMT